MSKTQDNSSLNTENNNNDVMTKELCEIERYFLIIKKKSENLPNLNINIKNLSYFVNVKEENDEDGNRIINTCSCKCERIMKEKEILKNISLNLECNSSTVILGTRMCGSTSLLRVIANHISKKYLKGEILCNNKKLDEYKWNKLVNYCGEDDILLPILTVKNTLAFANKCLNDSNIDELNEIISILGLDDCKNNIIGNEFLKGCSGGEIKRTSIAESILSPAKILLMDKITTGLDSSTAYNICKMLVRRTKVCDGILVCTLLQPSPDIISLFDNVILMNDGEIKYFGKTKNIISIFKNKKLLINDNNFNEIYDVIDSYKLENNCKEINDCSDKEENDVKKNDNMKKNKLYEKKMSNVFLKRIILFNINSIKIII